MVAAGWVPVGQMDMQHGRFRWPTVIAAMGMGKWLPLKSGDTLWSVQHVVATCQCSGCVQTVALRMRRQAGKQHVTATCMHFSGLMRMVALAT